MALIDVRQVFVVQDRATGAFVDINMGFVQSLRHAARAESREIASESMHCALYEDQLQCPEGFEVHAFFESND
jgi:hypothetical protein